MARQSRTKRQLPSRARETSAPKVTKTSTGAVGSDETTLSAATALAKPAVDAWVAPYIARIVALEQQVAELRRIVAPDEETSRKSSRRQIKKEVAEYFDDHHDETVYASDIANERNLDYDTVRWAIDELEKEGLVGHAER